MPYLAAALLILLLAAPSNALAQAGVSYQIPADNPLVGQQGAAHEVYAKGLRNPYRWSFDRQTGDILIGDVGQATREEIDWVTAAAARNANFGWACREGKIAGPRPDQCPVPGAIEPLFDYGTPGPDAVTGGFVVRDPSLTGLEERYLYGDFFAGDVRSLALDPSAPTADDETTGLAVPHLVSFGEDASQTLYAVSLDGSVSRLVAGTTPGTLAAEPLTGPFTSPIAIGTFPGDSTKLFVAERAGKVRLVVNDAVRPTPFIDAEQFVLSTGGERGMQSVVAAPDYDTSGHIYVFYSDLDGDARIDEFTRSEADPETADPLSRRNVLTIEHSQWPIHYGGQLHFGADGCLWISTGDGGGDNDDSNNAQNAGSLLGKLLRIDPDPPGTGGPLCGGPAPPAPPIPPTGPTPDTTAPGLSADAARRQRVMRKGGAAVTARCDEPCSLSVGGTLLIGQRKLLLRRVPATLSANQSSRLLVRLRHRGRRLLRAALRRGGHPRVVLRLRATDSAGNRSALVRRGVRVRR